MKNNNSIWIETAENTREYRTLDKNRKTDVCIIGGGITGLQTAYYLSKEGMKVVVLEKDKIGSKTSGNTTGKLTSQHHLFYDYLIHSQNKDFAKKYLKANEEAICEIDKIIDEEKIDCNFERKSSFVWTNQMDKIPMIQNEVESVKSLGEKANFINEIEVLGKIEGAIEFENQAQFHPVKYMQAIAKCILENGGEIFENTKVVDYEKENDGFVVKAEAEGDERRISAKFVVVATRYPIFNVPGFHFIKMYQELEYGIAIKSDVRLNGMYVSLETPTISFRNYNDNGKNYILIVGNGQKTGVETESNGFGVLKDFAKKYFPDSRIVYRWNAEDSIGLDKIAYIGEYSEVRENMYVATGFKKWGMTTSNIAARLITDKIMGRENKYEALFDSTRIEPIKNKDEMKNMLKEMGENLIKPRFTEGEKKYCAHLGGEVSWNEVTETWDCPLHGSRYEEDGRLIEGPATKDLT